MAFPRLMIAGFAALASVVYASPCNPSSVTDVTTASTETATAASGSLSIDIHSFSSFSTTTSVETMIISESLSSFLSSYTTTEESKTTTEQATTTTTDMTTSTEATTTISQCNSMDPLMTVALANPTPVFDDNIDHDDESAPIVLPFGIGPNGATTIYISTNGIVSLGSGADAYLNEDLPTESIPAIAYLPYWDDMYLSRTYKNTIVYEVFDGRFGPEATIEWIVGKGTNAMFHFDISFLQRQPNAVRFRYYTTSSRQGASAIVGTQNRDNGKVIKIEYNTPDSIADGTAIILDTETGSQTMTTFDNTECGKNADRNVDSE